MSLEKELKQLQKINPHPDFIQHAKQRLLAKIDEENESWLKVYLKNLGQVLPSPLFLAMARQRLLSRISQTPQHINGLWHWLKRGIASVSAMAIIVLSTLFFIDGGQYVNALQNNYLYLQQGQVVIERADEPGWQQVSEEWIIKEGDTIQLKDAGTALITFFEDTQLRLSNQATVIINKIDPLARQGTGLIEVSLLAGQAWLQAVNVPDHFHSFTLRTPHLVLGADQTSVDIAVTTQNTTIRVFKHQVETSIVQEGTGNVLAKSKLSAGKTITVKAAKSPAPLTELASVQSIPDSAKQETWVQKHREQDELHLLTLAEREMHLREKVAGVLPGHFLYPLKQAKEHVVEALAFTQNQENRIQLNLANKRLTEAIVLVNQKQYEKASNALVAYQSIVREIANRTHDNRQLKVQVEQELIARNTKSLVASLPQAPIHIVREAINTTEELITDNPLELEKVRLENMVDHLAELPGLIEAGNVQDAKEVLLSYETLESRILTETNKIADTEQRKAALNEVLVLRNEGLSWIKSIQEDVTQYHDADNHLVALVQAADQSAQREINKINALVKPLLPEAATVIDDPLDKKADRFVERVEIYQSWQGQKNQINVLLERLNPKDQQNIELLAKIRANLTSPRARDLINAKMLELKSTARYNKHKAVERKLERAKRLRE